MLTALVLGALVCNRTEILAAATQSLVSGAWVAYLVGAVAILAGTVLVADFLTGFAAEKELVASYARADDPVS